MTRKKKLEMEILNPNACGIDIGSRSHFVAIGQSIDDVSEFGVYAEDLINICEHLKKNGVTSVAMESTGDYWQNLFAELIRYDFDVVLCNGKFTKHAKGKKTDVKDSRWIQKLHTLGLLTSSFLPDEKTEILRTYYRQRASVLRQSAATSLRMMKFLKFLNFRLDVVVNDVCGLTGLAIIDQICKGNLEPTELAKYRHYNCKKSEEEIAKALHGNNRKDFLFGLKQEYTTYCFLQKQLQTCDVEIDKFIKEFFKAHPALKGYDASKATTKRQNKNTPQIKKFSQIAYQYFEGVDLLAIEGVSYGTTLSIMAEIGPEGFKKFGTSAEFTSWLRLAPNTKISGGRILSSKTPKGSNRLKIALRQAANTIGNLKGTYLSGFFQRIAYRKGRTAAISATARKLAVIIWNMITKKTAYQPPESNTVLNSRKRQGLLARMKKNIERFEISPIELGILTPSIPGD
jgi:transposase